MSCPNDEFLLDLVNGALEPAQLAEADRHLDGCDECRDLVAELARAAGGGGVLPRGAELDRYEIVDVLGRGAMGVVYSAFDPELDRRVALKLLRAELSASSRAQLLGEARAMARLSHPNVVAVYDARSAGDAVFVAMEQIDGRTLREWLADEQPGWREICDAFIEAARGLAAAHRVGLVHRDFKPDNVLVGDDRTIKVGDFGLAVAEGDARGSAGTPAYMAPEQLAGSGADARSDQFSFCAALYEALAGERPAAPPAPIAGVPRWLDRAIARGLEADAERRWPDLEALIAALDRKDLRPRIAGWVAAGLGAGAIAAVIASAGDRQQPIAAIEPCTGAAAEIAAVWNPGRAAALARAMGRSRSAYERPALDALVAALDRWRDRWVETRTAVCRATQIEGTQSERLLDVRMHCLGRGLRRADALIEQVSRAGRGALPAIPSVIAKLQAPADCATQALTLTEPPTREQAEALPALERRLDAVGAAIAIGDHRRALDQADALVADAAAVGFLPFHAEALLARSRARRGLDRHQGAAADARAALVSAERAAADALAAEAVIALASLAAERGDLVAAAQHRELAAAAVARVGEPRELALALARVAGLIHYNRGELEQARHMLERALELTGDRVEAAAVLTGLGNIDRAAGDLEAALARHHRAGELDRARFGDHHPAVARALHNQAGVLRLQGKTEEALVRYRQALAIKQEAFGADHSEVALTRNSIALVHLARGDLAAARAELEAALAIYSRLERPERAGVLRNLGLVAERAGDRREARARFKAAMAVGGPSVDAAALRADLARVSRRRAAKPRPAPKPRPATYMPGQAWD